MCLRLSWINVPFHLGYIPPARLVFITVLAVYLIAVKSQPCVLGYFHVLATTINLAFAKYQKH